MSTNDTAAPAALDITKATGDLFAALAKAQADVESVGKDGTNTQRGYRYATTEAMIRGSRQHLAGHGLAFFSTWSQAMPSVAQGDIGKQHVAALVTIHWVLGHATGGQVSGTAHMDAIGSPARPPDKAVAAAVTYGLGFVLRGLLLLDRADEDEHSPDKRQEPEPDRLWLAYEAKLARVASYLGLGHDRAQERILATAEIAKTRDWTDPEVERMIAAAERLLAPRPEPKTPGPDRDHAAAKGEQDVPEPAAKPRAKAKTSKPTTDVAAVEAQAHWLAAGTALVNYRTADYIKANGEEPDEALVAGFRRDAMGISERAIGVEPGQFPRTTGTVEQYNLAASQLREALVMRKNAAGGA